MKTLKVLSIVVLLFLVASIIPAVHSSAQAAPAYINYTVQKGDSLWLLSNRYSVPIAEIKRLNNLQGDIIYVGQVLRLPAAVIHTVVWGDTLWLLSLRYGTTVSNLKRWNNLSGDMIYVGQRLIVSPGATAAPAAARKGELVDWWSEGRYILPVNDVFSITDVLSGRQFKVKRMGGVNHCDVEPYTAADTAVMYELFGYRWTWTPRAVIIHKNGRNMAGSLSGMPHSIDTVSNNNVTGHFDLYMHNCEPHGTGVSPSYVAQHRAMVLKAAGF